MLALLFSIKTTIVAPWQLADRQMQTEFLASNNSVSEENNIHGDFAEGEEGDDREIPPLLHYIDKTTQSIKHDKVQELLDFVIVGFPKTGTTFLMRSWLGSHPEICMFVSTWVSKKRF